MPHARHGGASLLLRLKNSGFGVYRQDLESVKLLEPQSPENYTRAYSIRDRRVEPSLPGQIFV